MSSYNKDDATEKEKEQRNILEASQAIENTDIRENNDWTSIINDRRVNSSKLNREIVNVETDKKHVEAEDISQVMSETEISVDPTGMTDFEKKTLQFVQNCKTVYEDSAEEPAMIYYNKEDKLFSFEYDDMIKKEQFKEWLKKQTDRFEENKPGHGTIYLKMSNLILTNNKSKNLIKIIYIMHKAEFAPLGIEMVNRGTARMAFQTKSMANDCLDFFKIHNKLVTAYIDNKDSMHKGIIKDWPKGIPELFGALDSRNNILKMERMKKRIWDKDANKMKYIASDNIIVTFKGKDLTDYVSIYNKGGHLRVRPYVEAVKLCYNCYKYGHLKNLCKSKAKCPICNDDFHGECNKAPLCGNCGEGHRANYRGCIEFQRNKDMNIIMAHNNCSYFEAIKLVEGREMDIPINYDRYVSPQLWPSLPSQGKQGIANKARETSVMTANIKEKIQHKRSNDNGHPVEEEHRANKVRVLENKSKPKFIASNINERMIKNNIRKSKYVEQDKEKKESTNLAYMSNYSEYSRNTSFQKENIHLRPALVEELYSQKENKELKDNKEYKEHSGNTEQRILKANRTKNLAASAISKTRTRATYYNI